MKDGTVLLYPGEIALLLQGQTINAIKAVRARTALGLKESKDSCDAYRDVIHAHQAWQKKKTEQLIEATQNVTLSIDAMREASTARDAADDEYAAIAIVLQDRRRALESIRYELGMISSHPDSPREIATPEINF